MLLLKVLSISIFFFLPAFVFSQQGYLSTSTALQKFDGKISSRSFVAFPEVRERPLIWIDSIPEKGVSDIIANKAYTLQANPGEYFVFQVGVWAIRNASDVKVEFSSLVSKEKKSIAQSKMTSFNTGGIDFNGKPFTKVVNVPQGEVQSLWLGVDLQGVEKGLYSGKLSVVSKGSRQTIPVVLKVDGEVIPNHGYDEGKRLSRLNWLNNYTLGVNEEITKGYTPVEVQGNSVRILGRSLKVGKDGFPELIESYFSPSNQSLVKQGEPIVNKSFRFVVEKQNGEKIYLKPGKLLLSKRSDSRAQWSVSSTSQELDLECSAQMEYDGFVDYRIKVKAKVPLQIKDIRLEVPVTADKSAYMMGLGHEGGLRKPDWKWQWDVSKNQDILWVGGVNGGMRIKLKAENHVGAICDVFYEFGKLNLPPSWGNGNKGGVHVNEGPDGDVLVNAFSGSRSMAKGQELNYDFELLITPLKVIDRDIKYNDRFFHDLPNCPELPDPGYNSTNAELKIGLAKKVGANILTIHHDVDILPFINYPCMDENIGDIKSLVSNAEKQGLKTRLYYTTRFMTVHQPEFWAFNSLNNEIVSAGPAEEYLSKVEQLKKGEYMSRFTELPEHRKWMLKYLRGRKYIAANSETMEEGRFAGVNDISVVTPPGTRLDNFYIGYFDWMVRNLGVDGFFLDEATLSRGTLRRARKILDGYRSNAKLDLHSLNHFSKKWGMTSCLNLYMDLLPYLDFTWIGEGRNYDRESDHYLVEISGIPFGVPGQMLAGGGNPWRGMVYGMTKRSDWIPVRVHSPSGMWKFWDEHSFTKKIMTGYWEKDCPVKSTDELIKATVYKGGKEVVIAIANWSDKDRNVSLQIDWAGLGLDASKVQITIPEIADFQNHQSLTSLNNLKVPGGKGYVLVLK